MRIDVVVAVLIFSAALQSTALAQAPSGYKKGVGTVATGGRFQLIQLSEYRRDQYMIDTATGRVWEPVCSGTLNASSICEGTVRFREVAIENLSDWKDVPLPAPKGH